MAMSAEHRSNFLPFIGDGDVSKWVKKILSGTKKPTQTNKQQMASMHFLYIISPWEKKKLVPTY